MIGNPGVTGMQGPAGADNTVPGPPGTKGNKGQKGALGGKYFKHTLISKMIAWSVLRLSNQLLIATFRERLKGNSGRQR